MPAPDHLIPILDRLGDGGTVPLAEIVWSLIQEGKVAASERAAVWTGAQSDLMSQQIADLGTALLNEFGDDAPGQPKFPDWEQVGPCGVALRILREQARELHELRAALVEMAPAGTVLQAQHDTYGDADARDPLALSTVYASTDPDFVPSPDTLVISATESEIVTGDGSRYSLGEDRRGDDHDPDDDIDWGDDPLAAGQAVRSDSATPPDSTALPEGAEPLRDPTPASAAAIRAWAREHDVDVPAKGAIPRAVRDQYNAAQEA